MATVLRNLRVNFASLVDSPANKGARVMLFKRGADESEVASADSSTPESRVAAIVGQLGDDVEKVGRKMSASRLAAMKDALTKLMSVLSEVDSERDDEEDGMKKNETTTTEVPAADPAAVTETEKPAAVVAESTDATAELAKRDAEIVELRKQADEAMKIAKAERDARLTTEYIAKAEREFPNLPRKAADLGPVLKRLDANETTDADRVMLRELLTAGNAAMAKAFTEIGSTGGSSNGDSAIEKINAKARELVAKGEAKSFEHGVAKVIGSDRELAADYSREMRARS